MGTYGTGAAGATPAECAELALADELLVRGGCSVEERRRLGFLRWLVLTGRVRS